MILTGLVILTLVSAVLPTWAVLRRRLKLSTDYFFLILYAEIFIYLHLAPTLWAFELGTELQALYFYLQLAAIVLFEIPILWLYNRSAKRDLAAGSREAPRMSVSGPRQLRLAFFAALLCAAFSYVAIKEDIFFMRIGYEGAVEALLKLTFPEFVAFRLFALSGAFLIGVLVVSIVFQRRERITIPNSGLVAFLTAFTAAVFFTYQALNSRLHTVLAVSIVLGILITVGRIPIASRKGLLVGGLSLIVAWYGFRVAVNARNVVAQGAIEPRIVNPFLSWEQAEVKVTDLEGNDLNDWRFRLNGLDLMARITPAAQQEGFAKGEAWRGFLLVMAGQLTLGTVISSEEVATYKTGFLSSPKKILMDRYLEGDWIDYPSCMLTDLYGNFGLLGLPIGAVIISWAGGLARRAFTERGSPASVVVALYVVFHLLLFEQELAVFFSSLVNTLPVLFLVILLNPMVAERRVSGPLRTRLATS